MAGRDRPGTDYCQHGFLYIWKEESGWMVPYPDCGLCFDSDRDETVLRRLPYKIEASK